MINRVSSGIWLMAGGMVFAVPTAAAAPQETSVKVVDELLACRDRDDSAARLACYDTAVAALDAARQKREIVVLDREAARQAKRSVFGFSLPKIKLFGGGDDEPEVTEINGTLTMVRDAGHGLYIYGLDDGSVWQTTDVQPAAYPKRGQPITIKAGLLGSYVAKVAKERGVKVKRIR